MMRVIAVLFCLLGHAFASEEEILRKFQALEDSFHKLERKEQQLEIENAHIREDYVKLQDTVRSENRRLTATFQEETTAKFDDLAGALDHMWLLICGTLVMLMQAGFAMVECGVCRTKNVQNILMKNLVDVCAGTVCWWAFGWTLAYGFECKDPGDKDGQVFAGNLQYFAHEFMEADANGNQTPTNNFRDWYFQWAFCATAATIVSGGVAERIKFPGYLIFTICMTTVIYPVVVAWMWSCNGWLTAGGGSKGHFNDVGFNDFAGSGIVHMTGGVAALVGAIAVGPRTDRWNPDKASTFDPHSLPLIVLGTIILWFGWYGFNCGSTLGLSSTEAGRLAAIVAMNTTLSASVGGIVVLVVRLIVSRTYEIGTMCNGILGGLVSITAGCGNVESGSACAIGAIGGLVYCGSSTVLKLVKVDDPIDAFSVHGACGLWGVLAAPLFDWGKGFDRYNGFGGGLGNVADANGNYDNLWAAGFAANLMEILMIIVWVGGTATIIFAPLRLLGLLRVDSDTEFKGMDECKHSPSKAYAMDGVGVTNDVI